MQQRFNMAAGRGPSPVIPLLLMVLTLVLVMNGWGGDGGRRETCNGGRSGGGSRRSVFSSIRGLPAVAIAIVGIHYFLSVMLPSYHVFPAAGNKQGDADEGYGLGTLLFLALFLILYNFF